MEKLIKQLQQAHSNEIASITPIGKAEINIVLNDGTEAESFSQTLRNHVVEEIDELEIIKINIVDAQGAIKDSFATNQ
jgi:hypothetical protein